MCKRLPVPLFWSCYVIVNGGRAFILALNFKFSKKNWPMPLLFATIYVPDNKITSKAPTGLVYWQIQANVIPASPDCLCCLSSSRSNPDLSHTLSPCQETSRISMIKPSVDNGTLKDYSRTSRSSGRFSDFLEDYPPPHFQAITCTSSPNPSFLKIYNLDLIEYIDFWNYYYWKQNPQWC